jgi:predicted flap endonuclease-1-like 5' DNA nuclease
LSRERIFQAIADAVARTPLAEALLTLLEETRPAEVVSGEPVPVAAEPATTIIADPASPKAPTSLEHLTMIGPGLRWRLSQLGVTSLDDLVAVDRAELKAQLGEIGRLVNLTTWVNAARLILAEGDS